MSQIGSCFSLTSRYHDKTINIAKGDETNRLVVLRDLLSELDEIFETVKVHEDKNLFFTQEKTISKGNYKITLQVEELK